MEKIRVDWRESTLYSECSWHQLAPYIGRMKSSMAHSLVAQFTDVGDTVYDPFCGAGTVALEAWRAGRHVVAGDLSPYAYVLSKAKLNPPKDVNDAMKRLRMCWAEATRQVPSIDLRRVPRWVRAFFHPETLRETIAVRNVLLGNQEQFLLSCLLGILHHWRPGFLSYPSSHTAPYLMDKRYPRTRFPEMYEYREVYPRLFAKVQRAFARTSEIDWKLSRIVEQVDASAGDQTGRCRKLSAIITSPPYMNSLSYARDNRLRLWFLRVDDHRKLERVLSPRKNQFLAMMRCLLPKWSSLLSSGAPCLLVLGAVRKQGKYHNLPQEVRQLVRGTNCGFKVTGLCSSVIPDGRRARVTCRSTREDTILLLRKRS